MHCVPCRHGLLRLRGPPGRRSPRCTTWADCRRFETLGITGTDTKLFATGFYGVAKTLGMIIFSVWDHGDVTPCIACRVATGCCAFGVRPEDVAPDVPHGTGTDTKLFATGFYGVAKTLGMIIFSVWLVEKVGRRSGLINKSTRTDRHRPWRCNSMHCVPCRHGLLRLRGPPGE
jgi:hypothetical protein